ncbi:VirD4-like conjugal transfer protein, CD1115 family [Pseudoscardovia suis]|uniref:VirD4-like conjugal transfer protein, CD1115 family n=1 Tax=Pseudoscardovia suis TaxID=987063 RepID=UPI003F968733
MKTRAESTKGANKTPAIVMTALACLAAWWVFDLTAAQIRTDHESGADMGYIVEHMFDRLENAPFSPSFAKADAAWGFAGIALVALFLLYRWASRKKMRDGEENGSAEWGSRKDIAPFVDKTSARNLLMTRTERLSLDTRKTLRNLNALVIGSSGSGKTRYYIMPNMRQMSMNYVVTDPKGELYAEMRRPLEDAGYTVHALDLKSMSHSGHFNPLRYIDAEHPEKSIRELTENIIVNTTAENARDDSFWGAAERTLLTALIAWVYFTRWHADGWDDETGIGAHEPSLNDVTDLLELMDAYEKDDTSKSPVDILMESAQDVYDKAAESEWAGCDDDARRVLEGIRFALRCYRRYSQGAGETKKSIIISLGVRLSPLSIHEVREILADDTIHIDELDAGKSAVFLILSDTDATFNFLAAVFYQCLFQTAVRQADANPEQRLNREMHCFLDEFANIGKIPAFPTLIATIRSRGISASIVVQNLAQLKALYKEQWETIAGNCDSTLFLGGNEETTTKWISDRLGKQTIDTRTTSQSKGQTGGFTINYQRAGRELMTPDELGVIPSDECVYLLRGVRPFLSRKIGG